MAKIGGKVKAMAKDACRLAGVELRKIQTIPPASRHRPVGDLASTLEDLRHRGFRPRSIVDIGANRGDWSRTAAPIFPEARLFLFEPVAAFEDDLRRFVESRPEPKPRYWIAAAGDRPGSMELNVVASADGVSTGSTFLDAQHDARYGVSKTSVPVVTLNDLTASGDLGGVPDLVKVDVEGFERQVLDGASDLFGKTDLFILETSFYRFWGQPLFHEMVAYLAERRYYVYDFAGFNRRPKDGSLGQADVCFVREGSALYRDGGWDD